MFQGKNFEDNQFMPGMHASTMPVSPLIGKTKDFDMQGNEGGIESSLQSFLIQSLTTNVQTAK